MTKQTNPNAAREAGQKYHNSCKHLETSYGRPYPFFWSVAHEPYTSENPRAHGNVSYTETCACCGATRAVNSNGGTTEVSPWGLPAAEIKRREREEEQRQSEIVEAAAKVEAQRQADRDREIAWRLGSDRRLTVCGVPVRVQADFREGALLLHVRYGADVSTYGAGGWHRAETLRLAAAQWQDGPQDDFRSHIYPAIGALIAA